jgi:CheY-like chemotaxis protein
VLVVDDDAAIRALLQDLLTDEGYTCFAESTAGGGLEQLQRVRPRRAHP